MKHFVPLIAVTVALGTTLPAWAHNWDEETTFDLRYSYELQTWSVATPAGSSLTGFGTPMHTFTVTDHSGMVTAAILSFAGTEGNRRMAEDDAIRNHKSTYTYAMREATPNPGLLLGMTLGQGTASGFTGSGFNGGTSSTADATLFRLAMGGDLFALLGGTFAWDTSYSYYGLSFPTGASGSTFSSTSLPFGLGYRWAPPIPIVSLLIEPSAHIDWRYLFGGLKGPALFDYGVTGALVLDPQWRLEARYGVGVQPVAGTGTADTPANLTTLSVGSTMYF